MEGSDRWWCEFEWSFIVADQGDRKRANWSEVKWIAVASVRVDQK